MNTVIDNCKMFLETHRNATGSWKDILSSVRDYIHNKLIQEYMKIDAHPFPNEIAGTGDKFMINKGHNVRNQSLEELRIQNNRKHNQERMTQLHNENNKMIQPIVDMKSAYQQVSKSKVRMNQNMVSATSSARR